MKKVLSFVLVLAMILGCTAMAFATTENATFNKATDYVAPFADAETSGVATILRDLGVLKGTSVGAEFDKTITRAEVCSILMRALGYEEICAPQATKFSDVPATHWASGYIQQAAGLKVVDGTTATTFNPDGVVTANEAIAFVIKALGYTQANLEGVWPANYVNVAKELGLLGTDLKAGTQEINREYAFTLIFNALDHYLVKWDAKNLKFINATQIVEGDTRNITLLTKVAGGTVTKIASLYAFDVLNPVKTADVKSFQNFKNAKNYVGKYVATVAMQTAPTKLVGIAKVYSKTVEGKFADDKYTTFVAIDGTEYTFNNNATKAGLYYEFNGVWADATNLAAQNVTSKTALVLEVVVDKTAKNDNVVCEIASAQEWKKTKTVIASATEAAFLASGIVTKQAVALEANWGYQIATKSGVLDNFVLEGVDSLADIAEDDVLELYVNKTQLTKMVVTRNVVTGALTNYNYNAKKYTVNGTVYTEDSKVAATSTDLTETVFSKEKGQAAAKAASEVAIKLNAAGKLVYIELVGEKPVKIATQYAIVLEAKTRLSYKMTGDIIDGTTVSSIRLFDFATGEEVKFDNVATAAGLEGILFDETGWATDSDLITVGALVGYKVKDDKLIVLGDAEFVSATDLKLKTTGFDIDKKYNANKDNTKTYADDVKIYTTSGAAKATATMAAFYKAKAPADLNKITAASIKYLEVKGRVVYAYVTGLDIAEEADIATAVAITSVDYDTTGVKLTAMDAKGVQVGPYVVTGTSVIATATEIAETPLPYIVKLEFTNGNVTKITYVEPAAEACKYDAHKFADNILKTSDSAILVSNFKDVAFMKWNTGAKIFESVASFEDAVFKGCWMVRYDTDADGWCDLITTIPESLLAK